MANPRVACSNARRCARISHNVHTRLSNSSLSLVDSGTLGSGVIIGARTTPRTSLLSTRRRPTQPFSITPPPPNIKHEMQPESDDERFVTTPSDERTTAFPLPPRVEKHDGFCKVSSAALPTSHLRSLFRISSSLDKNIGYQTSKSELSS